MLFFCSYIVLTWVWEHCDESDGFLGGKEGWWFVKIFVGGFGEAGCVGPKKGCVVCVLQEDFLFCVGGFEYFGDQDLFEFIGIIMRLGRKVDGAGELHGYG